ncbi:unnamed protein product [Cladocopium goreaui]|uniref:Uncharacterized protein n=1 Tax=Cladocopium goreaui TaxID=2562237 RepID=A0A9P1CNP7_9DINO|nr:unnamed protein product [Cladocopium goreaui]
MFRISPSGGDTKLVWSNILRFLPASTHGTCDTCCDFKEQFRRCSDSQSKYETARLYKQHLDAVSKDRQLEEFLQDGMDQSKWSLPRQRLLQRAKDTQNLLRPRYKAERPGELIELQYVEPEFFLNSVSTCLDEPTVRFATERHGDLRPAAVLALPYQFAARIMNTAATEPRQLKKVQSDKAKKYLEVCQVLMQRFPTDTSGRSVEFLLDLVNNTEPGEAPPLPWISTASPADAVQVGRPRLVERLAPAVNFEARFAHR